MHFLPAPSPVNICLKAHDVDTFNVHPRIEIELNGKPKLLPANLGIEKKNGKDCMHVIHTDKIGDILHVQFVRPIRLTLHDFMKIYASNNKTINVVDNSTGKFENQTLILNDYKINYSYFSNNGFAYIQNLTQSPPFTDKFLGKISLRSK